MKIISQYSDYYDYALGYSEHPIWRRNTSVLSDNVVIPNSIKHFSRQHSQKHYNLIVWVLYFCGNLYPIYYVNGNKFSTIDQVFNYLDNNELLKFKKDLKSIKLNCKNQDIDINNKSNLVLEQPLVLYCNPLAYTKSLYKIIINPNLKDLGFSAAMDAYIVYQYIEQWLNNQVTCDIIGNTGTDLDILHSKGFDKWSFRKQPQLD